MSESQSRRSILKSIVLFGAAGAASPLLEACGSSSGPGGPPVSPGDAYFPQSVASGDPKPGSVILWTRAVDAAATGDLPLRLQVATDASFSNLVLDQVGLLATAEHDGCIKVKVASLSPRTTYAYRFLYEKGGSRFASRTGTTRTAPAATDDVPVKFAVVNCQDYIGHYFNAHQRIAQLASGLDFFVAIGDYIYETVNDASFQSPDGVHAITFTDAAGALTVGTGTKSFQAAQSLSNYRQLYKTYKADAQLQAVHEALPMIITWDDHEFSDDCWGDHATYYDGLKDETSLTRRRNGEQAFFEYQPIDDDTTVQGAFATPSTALYPNVKLWRSFQFGKQLELIMTDYRSFRPDHLIPEDAFPGAVIHDGPVTLDKANLLGLEALHALPAGTYESLSQDIFAVVNIDDPAYALHKTALLVILGQLYQLAGLSADDAATRAASAVTGSLSVLYLNALLEGSGATGLIIPTAGKDKAICWVQLGKQDLFTKVGSRYVVVKPLYDLYSGIKYALTQHASENVYGADQEAFVKDRLKNSTATWRTLVSSTSFTSMTLDLSNPLIVPPTLDVPATLRQNFYFDVDQWDGFPEKRAELIQYMVDSGVANALFVCGDIHAGYLSKAGPADQYAVVTSPAISSGTLKSGLASAVVGLGYATDSAVYQTVIGALELLLKASNTKIAEAVADVHGFATVAIDGAVATSTLHMIPATEVKTDYAARGSELPGKFTTVAYKLQGGVLTKV